MIYQSYVQPGERVSYPASGIQILRGSDRISERVIVGDYRVFSIIFDGKLYYLSVVYFGRGYGSFVYYSAEHFFALCVHQQK